jgi:two-component system sensor histidine kinase/response regulator
MHGTHHPALVALSILIAAVASFAALDLAGRVTAAQGRSRILWLLGGSFAMGVGIWSMHFTAMLAYRLPVSIAYAPGLTAFSVLIAIGASLLALFAASRRELGVGSWAAAGLLMGGAIAGMHYTGMAAVRVPGQIGYDLILVLASLAIAVAASVAALWLARHFRGDESRRGQWGKAGSAVVMAIAIAGMHYTAMAVAVFVPAAHQMAPGGRGVLATGGLAAAVVIGTLVILGVALVGAMIDRQIRAQLAAAETIRESESRYRLLFERNPNPMWVYDPETLRFLAVNEAAVHHYGYSQDEFLSMSLRDIRPPQEIQALEEAVRDRHEGRSQSSARHRKKDGTIIEVEMTASDIVFSKTPSRFVLINDITARKRAEEALIENQRMLSTLMGNLPGMAYRCRNDADWTIEFINEGALAVTGYAPAELLPGGTVAFGSLIHADDQERIWNEVQAALAERRPFHFTYRIRTASGEERWVWEQGTGIFSPAGEPLALEGFVMDITERKRAEEATQRLAAIVESSDDAITSKSLDGIVLSWNAGAERVYGYRAEEMIGKSVTPLLDPNRPGEEADILARIRSGNRVEHYETVRIRRDGRRINISLSVSPLRDGTGEVVGASVIARDITQRKQAEEELIRTKEAAEAANRAKSDFLANMSHELRTPLNSVIGFSNVLRKNKAGNLREQDLGYLERIHSNGTHLLGLINAILDLSKIEAGKMELEIAPVSVESVVVETLDQLKGAVRGKDVELRAAVPEGVAPIETDAGKLKQVLINLVGNAIKFTEKGSVTVSVTADPETGRPARIDVRDTGIGIPPERLSAIFEAFEQAERGTARRFGGTGLGLAISRSLSELMGYRLKVESTVGEGSTFSIVLAPDGPTIRIPGDGDAARAIMVPAIAAPGPAVPPGEGSADVRGKLVLVIDDETDSRMLLTHHLEEFGCQTITASTGEQGLRMAREFRPDLITLDLLLPGMTGWEILRALKADPELCEIPVVIVSIVAEENRGSVLGAVDLIEKPIERSELLAVLQRHLRPETPGRVLIVDDEADARDLLATYLREEAVEIRAAVNGKEALRVLEDFSPDLIVLDLLMPELDGIGLLQILQGSPAYRHIPVVVVTAKELSREEIRSLSHEALAVLSKDAELEEDLHAVIRQICTRATRTYSSAALAPSASSEARA